MLRLKRRPRHRIGEKEGEKGGLSLEIWHKLRAVRERKRQQFLKRLSEDKPAASPLSLEEFIDLNSKSQRFRTIRENARRARAV